MAPPANVPLGPVCAGAVNVTVAPTIGRPPPSFTVANRGAPNAAFIVVLWGVPLVGVIEGGAVAVTVKLSAFVAVCEFASVTVTLKLLAPDPVGVPEIAPVPDASVRPAGKVPVAMNHEYGVVPPAAVSEALYATFCVPFGSDTVVMDGEEIAVTLTLNAFVAVCALASVTVTLKLLVPDPVGVPEIAPVPDASVKPAGKFPEAMDHLYGIAPPVAASVAL